MQPLIPLSQVNESYFNYKMDMDATSNMENKTTAETSSASVLEYPFGKNDTNNYDHRKYLYDLAINFDNYKPLALQSLQPQLQQTDSSANRNQSNATRQPDGLDSSSQQMTPHLRLDQFPNDFVRSNDRFNGSSAELYNSSHEHLTTDRRNSIETHNGQSGTRPSSTFSNNSNNNNRQVLLLSPTRGDTVSTVLSSKPIISTGFYTKPSQLPYTDIGSSSSPHHDLNQILPKIPNNDRQSKVASPVSFDIQCVRNKTERFE